MKNLEHGRRASPLARGFGHSASHWVALGAEKLGESPSVERGGHEDQLETRPGGEQLLQDDEQEVGVEVALVNLVHKHVAHLKRDFLKVIYVFG